MLIKHKSLAALLFFIPILNTIYKLSICGVIKKYNMTTSFSRKGCPYDNVASKLELLKYIEG